jgi:hypothetical protein
MRLRGVLGTALAVGLSGIPFALLLANVPKPHARHRPSRQIHGPGGMRTPSLGHRPGSGQPSPWPVGAILTALLVIALAAAVITCVMLRRQAGRLAGAFWRPRMTR